MDHYLFSFSSGFDMSQLDEYEVHFSFKKNEKSNIDLACAANVVGDIFKEYPRSVLFWTKNGEVLAIDRERMQLGLTELSILELTPQDSGVYLCSIRYAPEVVKPMAVISVAVIPKKPTFEVHEEESVTLTCHGSQLEKIYKDLSQEWFHGKKVYKEFKNSTLIESNVYEIKNVTSNMTGEFECIR
ncbi:thrombospondin-1 [Caerostris darwini]|uniref:Thrombospondin-1 n=1 Tax=Caerostris darwini TaxID=1538125 RepID=A0AAV4V8M3_9ARAC|nr:thrombospondin-1 [Caerostris darwini]